MSCAWLVLVADATVGAFAFWHVRDNWAVDNDITWEELLVAKRMSEKS